MTNVGPSPCAILTLQAMLMDSNGAPLDIKQQNPALLPAPLTLPPGGQRGVAVWIIDRWDSPACQTYATIWLGADPAGVHATVPEPPGETACGPDAITVQVS